MKEMAIYMNIIDVFSSMVDLLNLLHSISGFIQDDSWVPIIFVVALNSDTEFNKQKKNLSK